MDRFLSFWTLFCLFFFFKNFGPFLWIEFNCLNAVEPFEQGKVFVNINMLILGSQIRVYPNSISSTIKTSKCSSSVLVISITSNDYTTTSVLMPLSQLAGVGNFNSISPFLSIVCIFSSQAKLFQILL